MIIKPVETKYRGYRFRSRLEARWAVFFDHLGVPWEYEREGFDLGKHGWYLPDFWLPKEQSWLEVKPDIPIDEHAAAKAVTLSKITGYQVLMVCGLPAPDLVCRGVHYHPHNDSFAVGEFCWRAPGRFHEKISAEEIRDLQRCCDAARSARFEHGEQP